MLPSLCLPHRLHLLGIYIFGAKPMGMLPRPTVPTGPSSTTPTKSKVAVYITWQYEGATGTNAAVEWVGRCFFEGQQLILFHKGGSESA